MELGVLGPPDAATEPMWRVRLLVLHGGQTTPDGQRRAGAPGSRAAHYLSVTALRYSM